MGRPDVDGMLAEMTSSQFAEWLAFARVEPFGEARADLRAGIVASTIANIHKAKGRKPYSPQDFMPDFEPEDEAAAVARMKARVMAALGGKR